MERQQQGILTAGILSAAGIAATIGAAGGYGLNFNAQTQYCLPKTDCRATDRVDSRVFTNFQQEAAKREAELQARRKTHRQRRLPQNWTANFARMEDDTHESWEQFSYGIGLSTEKAKNLFGSASTRRFLDNTAEARYRGWQLQVYRQHDGHAGWRRLLAAISGISFFGALWLLQVLEDEQPRLDIEAAIDTEFHEKAYRQQKQSAFSLWLEGLSWNMAEAELVLKETFTGMTRRQLARLEGQIDNPQLSAATSEEPYHDTDQPALTGQSLDEITSPKNKVNPAHNRPVMHGTVQHGAKDPVKETWEFIRNWEGGWIILLLESPVLIWGGQGSFKSYFAAYLALLRYFLKGHTLEIADPHLSLNKNEAWKALLQLGIPAVGEKRDYGAVARRIQEYFRRLDAADDDKAWHTAIFDEVTQYALKKPTKAQAPELILSCISDARKGKEGTILISHNKTQALLGGVEGAKKSLEEGLIQLHLFNTRDRQTGKFTPQFRGEINGLTDDSMDFSHITIDPHRMHPEYLLKLFTSGTDSDPGLDEGHDNGVGQGEPQPTASDSDEPQNLWHKAIARLDQLWELPATPPTPPETPLTPLPEEDLGEGDTGDVVTGEENEEHRNAEMLPPDGDGDTSDTAKKAPERLPEDGASRADEGTTENTYTPANLSRDQVLALVEMMKLRNTSMTKIIETLWGVTKSGRSDSPWQRARSEYRELTGE
jgi:hypothetical protein